MIRLTLYSYPSMPHGEDMGIYSGRKWLATDYEQDYKIQRQRRLSKDAGSLHELVGDLDCKQRRYS